MIFAVCAQNDDIIYLMRDGEALATSDFIIAVKNENSTYTIDSFCIEGTCFSRFSSGNTSNIYFVQISDAAILKQLKENIQEAKQEVIKNNRGIDNYKILLRNYTNMYLVANTKHGKYYPFNQLIIEKIDEFKKYPFLDISSIKNNFNHDNCSYTRAISYDIESKIISVREKNDYDKRF